MSKHLENIFDLNPASRVLVEASAGTGKTYTIVGIYVRMLVEQGLKVDQLLTVTFTKKATAELRERILSRLRDCLLAVQDGDLVESGDEFLSEFQKRYKGSESVISILKEAIQNFDDSQVFTIHGFCQKILQEEALSAGTPFEMSVNPSGDLYETAAEDFWRMFMDKHGGDDAGRYLISKLLNIAETPAELIGKNGVSALVEKHYAQPEGEVLDNPKDYLQELIDLKSRIKEIIDKEAGEILSKLKNCDVSRYATHLDSRWQSVLDYVEDDQFKLDAPSKIKFFTSDYLYDESNLIKNGREVEPHELYDLFSELNQLSENIGRVESTLIMQAYDEIKKRRENLSKSSESYSYNDLLICVRDALLDPDRGEFLIGKLNRRYPIALVDEFQDTDPVQYEIFKSIYPTGQEESSLMMIGDPKQAIYAFRGADLHTYFRARKDGVDEEYTLKHNYRSTVQYIESINQLFESDRNPFIENEIDFEPSKAGREDHTDSLIFEGEKMAPLQVISRHGVQSSKESAIDFAFKQTVVRISQLMNGNGSGSARIGNRPVEAGDIAILISRNKDAYDLQQRLKAAGIDSVTKTDQNVFNTLEAKKLEMLMNSVLNPTDQRIFNAGLLTGIFGFDLASLYELSSDEDRRQVLIGELSDLEETWRKEGFYSMFYRLIFREQRLVNLSELNRSERIITNFFHLADLCSKAENEHLLSPDKLHTWLLRQMEESDEEEKELQLESDRNLVKIMTIHSSKGLQFPIVFCPTLWMGYKPKSFESSAKQMVEYHSDESDDLIINFDRIKNERRVNAEYLSDIESVAEDVRKAYVALTRAQYASIVIWESHTHSNVSGLGASIVGRHRLKESIKNKYKVKEGAEISDSDFISAFKSLQDKSDNSIELKLLSSDEEMAIGSFVHDDESEELMFHPYQGPSDLKVQNRLESFTSLAGHSSDPGTPDYDQLIDSFSAPFEQSEETKFRGELTIFDFPKGATAGTAIHKLFEAESFEFSSANSSLYASEINEILEDYSFDKKWAPVLQKMMRKVADCKIPGFDLSKLSRIDERREMEFNFAAGAADGGALLETIREGKEISQNEHSNRYMTGFIDLVARQNGSYMIIDYKSNYLGDTKQDYTPESLEEEILNASYDLQYHLYTVALIKYLRSKIPDFDYDKDFAGVAYLFVRGIEAGSSNGVWFHKPDKDVILKLEHMLSRKS